MKTTASTPTPSLRERQRERARADILAAVIRVYSDEHGTGPVIDQLTAAAGLARGTLYAHFPGGVDELLIAAYELLGREFVQRTQELLSTRTGWRERMMTHAEVMAEWGAQHPRGVFYNVVGPRHVPASRTGTGASSTLDVFSTELAAAQESGELPADLDTAAIAEMLTGCVKVIGVQATHGVETAERFLDSFRTLLGGLERP